MTQWLQNFVQWLAIQVYTTIKFISDFFNALYASGVFWLQTYFNSFAAWLHTMYVAILDNLNPVTLANSIAQAVADFLPAPNADTEYITTSLVSAVRSFFNTISWFDFFIDLRFMMLCIGIMVLIETILIPVRSWRLIRSFIT